MMAYKEFEFTLPKGLMDDRGTFHRQGRMRLTTGQDELVARHNPRVRDNPAYGLFALLAVAIAQLGTVPQVTPELLEQLFVVDLTYLQNFYRQIHQQDGEFWELGET